jgi:hypothetical protein
MRKGRRLFVGGLVSAGLSLLLAPRVAGSRRAALSRLRARGAASGAFSGTPCSATDPSGTVAVVGRDAGAAPAGDDVGVAPAAERATPAPAADRDAAPAAAGDDAATTAVVSSAASDPKEDA